MQSILDAINEWIKEILIGAINGNLSTMFGDVNEKVGTIAAEVGKTPQGWNAGIFSMIQSLSENVIVPIAGLVITYVLCVELISMITEKNNILKPPIPVKRLKKRYERHRQKLPPGRNLPGCNLPTRNALPRSLKSISRNPIKPPTAWIRQRQLSPKKRNW